MHKAAEGNYPNIMAYLKELGHDIDCTTEAGKTPLMCAADVPSELAACFLIAWHTDLDR